MLFSNVKKEWLSKTRKGHVILITYIETSIPPTWNVLSVNQTQELKVMCKIYVVPGRGAGLSGLPDIKLLDLFLHELIFDIIHMEILYKGKEN